VLQVSGLSDNVRKTSPSETWAAQNKS